MPSTAIKSCNQYALIYKDSTNKTHQQDFYAHESYDSLFLARGFNSYINDHPGSVIRTQKIF